MRQEWWLRLWAISLALSGVNMRAQAQTCEQDSECGKGFSCQVTGAGTCPAIRCAPGEMCMQPACDPVVYRECQPAQCSTDSDCAAGMVCYANMGVVCASPAVAPCPPGQMCPEVKPTECFDPPKTCTPRYLVPCQEASDCGAAGWECKAVQACSCSGSSGAATPPSPAAEPKPVAAIDGGAADVGSGSGDSTPPADQKPADMDAGTAVVGMDPSCECHDLAVKQCQPIEMTCELDGDCPADFVCQHATAPMVSGSGSCSRSEDGGFSCTTDPPPPPPPTEQTPGNCWPKDYGTAKSGSLGGIPMASTSAPAGQGTNGSAEADDASLRSRRHDQRR